MTYYIIVEQIMVNYVKKIMFYIYNINYINYMQVIQF